MDFRAIFDSYEEKIPQISEVTTAEENFKDSRQGCGLQYGAGRQRGYVSWCPRKSIRSAGLQRWDGGSQRYAVICPVCGKKYSFFGSAGGGGILLPRLRRGRSERA